MCGRVIIEDFIGPTLSQLSHVPWLERADYARQLLEMAQEFSYSEFRLYLTDVSLDNFAVDSEGRVKIIDAENIVIVDPSGLDLGKFLFSFILFNYLFIYLYCIIYTWLIDKGFIIVNFK